MQLSKLLPLCAAAAALYAPARRTTVTTARPAAAVAAPPTAAGAADEPDAISAEHPLRVTIAGAGVGGLTLANALKDCAHVEVKLVEKTSAFKRFGGPIQLASNAMQLYKERGAGVRFLGAAVRWHVDRPRDDTAGEV